LPAGAIGKRTQHRRDLGGIVDPFDCNGALGGDHGVGAWRVRHRGQFTRQFTDRISRFGRFGRSGRLNLGLGRFGLLADVSGTPR
jgi:hypothetical protein